jgi:serine/threonine-protein kinase HipA
MPDNHIINISKQPTTLRVTSNGTPVGTIALTKDGLAAFEYSTEWLARGYSISPLSLPLEKLVFVPKLMPFDGMFGVFEDSLPDGWGRLLVDRVLLQQGVEPSTITPLTRLAIVGKSGMGALAYEPEIDWKPSGHNQDLDILAAECSRILRTEYSEDLDELFALGGSSGGARPKIMTTYNGEDWIIKFPSSVDDADVGAMEYRYALAARQCGIEIPEVKLFPSKISLGYFGVKRFDRRRVGNHDAGDSCANGNTGGITQRIHYVSVSALLETSHRIPSLDYTALMHLTLKLTHSFEELEKLYRLMCFNVLAQNRDDHSKNFAFIYDPEDAIWRLSPAYDLTYNTGFNGEHATTVAGKGRDITLEDLIELGQKFGLSKTNCRRIAVDIEEKTNELTYAYNGDGKKRNSSR